LPSLDRIMRACDAYLAKRTSVFSDLVARGVACRSIRFEPWRQNWPGAGQTRVTGAVTLRFWIHR
jgi:hypothetical protein